VQFVRDDETLKARRFARFKIGSKRFACTQNWQYSRYFLAHTRID
jgi:hypothetical protein